MDRQTSITKPDFFYLLSSIAGQTSPIPHTTFVSKQNEAKRSVDGETWAWFLKTLLLSLYSEVPNKRADGNKRAGLEKNATLLAYLPSKSINEQGGIFRLLHEKLRAGWNENLKNLSEHALLLGTSE